MKVAASVALLVAGVAPARATTFDEYAPGKPPAPARQLREAACTIAVEVRGAIANVELSQRIANPGPYPRSLVYADVLPRGAVVTGFGVRRRGRLERAVVVDGQHPSALVESDAVLGPDPAVLRAAGDGRYEIVAQPIAAGAELELVTQYSVALAPRAGALHLALPGRTSAAPLAACRGRLRAVMGPRATVARVRFGARAAGKAPTAFTLGANDLAIELGLDVAGKRPAVWTQTQPIAAGWHATQVTVLAPRLRATGARRVVFVVDTSRSMELVGRATVTRVLKTLAAALPAGAEVEAILYDRTATRVFGELRAATATNLAAIEAAIARRPASNGSDIVKAFALAGQAVANVRGQAMVVVVTDGVVPELPDRALIDALGAKLSTVDVHAIVLDPAHTRSPGATVLRAPIHRFGGAYVEVSTSELETALTAIDEWLRPGWLDLELSTGHDIPAELRGGGGFTRLVIHRGAPRFILRGHAGARFELVAARAPAAPVATLAVAGAVVDDFVNPDDDDQAQLAEQAFAKAIAAHGGLAHDRAFAVLSTVGRIAASRRAMIAGGGRYERAIALPDPPGSAVATAAAAVPTPLATPIARLTLERLFRDQLYRQAYACYQRALGLHPDLAGTVHFQLRLGRGEVTHVRVTGLGDAKLDACLEDAAYDLTPPFPDFTVNSDDQTIANYPLTFTRRQDKPIVVLGDADSSSPLDIDAIEGGVPTQQPGKVKVKVKARTPLGGMKPPRSR